MTEAVEDHANVPVLPPILFAAGLGAGYLLRGLVPVHLVSQAAEDAAAAVGTVLTFLGLLLGGWALATFFRARTTPLPNRSVRALVTWGPYRLSRNPMYTGMSIATVGLALIANTPWLLAVLPLVWLALRRLVIDREEKYLERKFGDEYRAFQARTRRWI